jgi:hypothetical protein
MKEKEYYFNSVDLIRLLKRKHIYGLFRRNTSLPYKDADAISFYRNIFFQDILDKQISLFHFFNFPFIWSETKEGYLFWSRTYLEIHRIIS